MNTISKILISLVLTTIVIAMYSYDSRCQNTWSDGEINTKSASFKVRIDKSYSPTIEKAYIVSNTNHPSAELPLGISQEKLGAHLFINSEREFFSIIDRAFEKHKIKELEKVERRINIHINLDEEGVPFQTFFSINHDSKITPDELDYIHKGIMERIRFEIKREIPFGEPCYYRYTIVLKFSDLLKGEFPVLKKNETMGKT